MPVILHFLGMKLLHFIQIALKFVSEGLIDKQFGSANGLQLNRSHLITWTNNNQVPWHPKPPWVNLSKPDKRTKFTFILFWKNIYRTSIAFFNSHRPMRGLRDVTILRLDCAYMRQWIGLSLAQAKACRTLALSHHLNISWIICQ